MDQRVYSYVQGTIYFYHSSDGRLLKYTHTISYRHMTNPERNWMYGYPSTGQLLLVLLCVVRITTHLHLVPNMRQQIGSALAHIRTCRLSVARPKSKPMLRWSLRHRLKWHFDQNTTFSIHENLSEYIVCEMAAILSRGRWVNHHFADPMQSSNPTIYKRHIWLDLLHFKPVKTISIDNGETSVCSK